MSLLEPAALADAAASAPDLDTFAGELLDRCARAIGFDVAYHAAAVAPLRFAARRGFSDDAARRMLERADVYTAELLPVKAAAGRGGGVAIDSEVFSSRERSRLAYYGEVMAPDHGRHAMVVVGAVAGAPVSVTMLGRTGSRFSELAVRTMRGIAPIVGLATIAHRSSPPARGPLLRCADRELVDYVALGYTNADIARARGTSPRTVRNQLSALYARLGVANRAELVGRMTRP